MQAFIVVVIYIIFDHFYESTSISESFSIVSLSLQNPPKAFLWSIVDTFSNSRHALLRNPGAQPLFHSDRGFQYTNRTFHIKLVNAGITQSMSRVAKCIDNGPMEGFWGILKRERYYGKRFTDRDTLEKMIEDYID